MIYGTELIKNEIYKIYMSYFHSDNQLKYKPNIALALRNMCTFLVKI